MLAGMGKMLILFGAVLVLLGVFLQAAGKVPWLGRLPGDILIQKKNVTFYFPLATSLVASVLVSLILYLFSRK